MQISVPVGPSAAAIRRAWPPPPKVQSTAVWPGWGASSSSQLGGEDGFVLGWHIDKVCAIQLRAGGDWGSLRSGGHLTRRSVRGQALGDLRRRGVELLLLLGPGVGVPDLQVLARADDDAGAAQARMLDQRLGHADAPGGVELLVEGAAVEAAAKLARIAPEGAVRREEAVGELLELLGRVHPDAGVEALGENDPIGEGGPEPGRNREAILGIETVLVETPKCHAGSFLCELWERTWKELGPE